MPDDHHEKCQQGLCYYGSNKCPLLTPDDAHSSELKRAREALESTLTQEGKTEEYIKDFLDHFDRNVDHMTVWEEAKAMYDRWRFERGPYSDARESIALRADEYGKPVFYISPAALSWLLDKVS